MKKEKDREEINLAKLVIITVCAVFILGTAVYLAFRYSQKQSGGIILPGGVTYLGETPSPAPRIDKAEPTITPIKFSVDSSVSWKTFSGNIYPYSFSYPSTLPLVIFGGDKSDSVAIDWGNIKPQQNVLLNIELIDIRDPSYLKKNKTEYVNNWYKFFPGLKGVQSVEKFTNSNGLVGYKAKYLNHANVAPNLDVFFEVPKRTDIMIHLGSGILDSDVFNRIVDSVKWEPTEKSTSASAATPTASPTPK